MPSPVGCDPEPNKTTAGGFASVMRIGHGMARSRIRGILLVLLLVQLVALFIGGHTHGGSRVAGGIIIATAMVEIVIIMGSGRRQRE